MRDKINFSEHHLKENLKFYYEARARRNLLAHRGRKPDQIYFDDLKRSSIDSKFHKKILRMGLYSASTIRSDAEIKTKIKSKKLISADVSIPENNLENLIDLSITPNFLSTTCSTLLMIKKIIFMDLKE